MADNRLGAIEGRVTDRLTSRLGVSVRYTISSSGSYGTFTAIIGRTSFRTTSPEGNSTLIWNDRDFLIPVTGFTIGGSAVTPVIGDRITEIASGKVYQVCLPTGVDEPCYRASGPQGKSLRIHCQEVS